MTGPATNWNVTTINGVQYLVISTAEFMVPLDWDPSSNMFIAVAAPNGGLGNFPALVQGAPGTAATLDNTINFTALAYSDPTPDSASFTTLGTGYYQLNLALHVGAPGASGTTSLIYPTQASDLVGTAAAGQIIVVNPTANGFVFAPQLCGDRFTPTTIANTPSGNPTYTLCSVGVPAQLFDWRPQVSGYCVVTGTDATPQVDLIARLNNATGGNEVGRATQAAAINPPTHVLSTGPPPGSADTYDRVYAGNAATIYLRAERQSGSGTFTTASATTRFSVTVNPIPGS